MVLPPTTKNKLAVVIIEKTPKNNPKQIHLGIQVRVMPDLIFTENLLRVPNHLHNKVHKCEKCRRYRSQSIFFIRNHVRRHSTFQPFDCEKNQVEKFSCGDCNLTSDHFILFIQHLKNFHSNFQENTENYRVTNYTCDKCSKFETYSLLILMKHKIGCDQQQSKNFGCSYCNFKCNTRQLLKNHKCIGNIVDSVIVKNGNCFECAHCCYKTKYKRDLKVHIIVKHTSDDQINWLKCDHCDYKCKIRKRLTQHINKKHNLEKFYKDCNSKLKKNPFRHILTKEWLKCEHCNYCTKNRQHWKKHLQKHIQLLTKTKLFKCKQCQFVTKYHQNLERHKKLHKFASVVKNEKISGINKLKKPTELLNKTTKWFKCDQCHFVSKYQQNLERHKKLHKFARVVVKNEYLLGEKVKRELSRHTRKIQWFRCKPCHYKTKYKQDLNRHLQTKRHLDNNVRWFKCETCNFVSKYRQHLKRHFHTKIHRATLRNIAKNKTR